MTSRGNLWVRWLVGGYHVFAIITVVNFVIFRVLCEKHGIDTPRDKPLHSLFGEYVKKLQTEGILQSHMTIRIMRSAISSLDAFNEVLQRAELRT